MKGGEYIFLCRDLKIEINGRASAYNFFAKSGEITVLLGKNGVGKTTLFKSMSGLLPIKKGEIFFEDRNITNLSMTKRSKLLAYLPQTAEHIASIRVKEYVLTARTPYLSLLEVPNQKHQDIVMGYLELWKVEHLKERFLHTLSGGEYRRVMLAKLFAQETPILLLDEPTTYLDFESTYELMEELKIYGKKYNKIIILILHDPNLAIQYADSFVLLEEAGIKRQCFIEEEDFDELMEETYHMKMMYVEGQRLLLRERREII